MPVSLIEWRVRIGSFIQKPPDINKQEMIQKVLERWKTKKEKTTTSTPTAQDLTPCQSTKEDNLKTAATPPSTGDQTPCQSGKKEKPQMAPIPRSPQDQTPCRSAKKDRLVTAVSPPGTQDKMPCHSAQKDNLRAAVTPPSTQDQALCESAQKDNLKTAASPPGIPHQTPCESAKKENPKMAASPSSTYDRMPCKSAKEKKPKIAASQPSTQDQMPCESAKKKRPKMAASQPSTQDQSLCQSAKKDKLQTAASPPSTQDQTQWKSAKEEKSTTSRPPPTQDQTPFRSLKKEKPKMAACPPSTQAPCTPSCTPQTNLVPSSADTCPVVMSSISQVILMLLTLMTACFQWCRKQCSSLIFGQLDWQVEKTKPLETTKFQVFLSMSCFASGLQCFRSMISNAMDGFFHLYLPLILLMKSGDIETNPGPNSPESTVSEMEFLKLARDIHPSYYTVVGVSLGIPYVRLDTILIEKLNNYPGAFMTVFMEWNVRQQPPNTNKREVLADALRDNDLGDLSEKLRNGCLLPNITGGPSRSPESQTQPPPSESETKPLDPELVERCANEFKSSYQSSLCKIRADPLDPASLVQFEDMYTELFLEEEHRRGKRALDYSDLLDLKVNGQFPKRLMVQGEAGAGKTTLCSKIAWDWIEGKYFKKFVWVLIVHLRDAKQYTLGQIAKSYLARNNPATACQLAEYIRSHQDKVFIAFDGLDEFSSKGISKSKCCQSHTPLQPSQSRADSSEACGSPPQSSDIRIVDIFGSVELASCPILVTTRPWRAIEIRSDKDLMKLYTFIHVEGFSRDNLSVYIHKYFAEDNAKAEQLIQFTHENDVISENMAHYPIYVAMLCLMWKLLGEQKLKEIKSLQTFSQIFKEMIGFLKEHYAEKKVEKVGSPSFIACLKEINKLLEPVAKRAFTGLLKNTLVFSDKDFQSCPESKETACQVGILSQADRIKSDSSSGANAFVQLPVFFPHKLFQEYMAGVYLASLYESDRSEFNRLIGDVVLPRKKEFRYLLYFTVSQNKTIAHCVMESMIQSYRPSPSDVGRDAGRDFIFDVAFESQDPDVAALVKDKVSSQGMKLIIHLDMTAHTVAGYAFTRLPLVDLLVVRDCGPTMSLDVAEMICSIPSLETATLQFASFHDDMYAVLAEKGRESKVQKLNLHEISCPTPASSHHLAEALCSMPNLNDLTLSMMNLSDEFYSTLKAMSSSLQVQTLILDNVEYPTPASSHDLAEALCSMPNLNDLKLYGMDLSDESYSLWKARASSLKGCFPQIRNGNFRFNGCPQEDLNSFLHSLETFRRLISLLSDHPQQQPVGDVHSSHQVHLPITTSQPSDHPQQQPMGDVDSVGQTHPPRRSWPSDHPRHQPVGDVHSSHLLHLPRRALRPSGHPQQQPISDVDSSHQVHPPRRKTSEPLDHPRQQPMGVKYQVHHPEITLQPLDLSPRQPTGDVESSYQVQSLRPSSPLDLSQKKHMGDVDSSYQVPSLQSSLPLDLSQKKPTCDVDSSHQAHPLRRKSQSSEQVPSLPTSSPLDLSQRQPIGDVKSSYQVQSLETSSPLDLSQRQPTGDIESSYQVQSLQTSLPLDLSQKKPTGDVDSSHHVHSPIITSHSSEQPQQPSHSSTLSPLHFTSRTTRGQAFHDGSSSDTVGQFSLTYSEGSCSQSRSHKRQAPSTLSRVPQEDPEIPMKQPKTGV